MNFVRAKGMATLALLLTLPVAACDDTTDTQFGSVSIQLTDAPGDHVVKAWVTITDIYLQEEPGDADPADSRFYLLENASETHELLSLANDVATLVAGATVPAGTYGQLRIAISEGCLITDANEVYASPGYEVYASPDDDGCVTPDGELQMPSYRDSGVKVLLNGLDIAEDQENVLLDFDVSQSFGKATGNGTRWVMDPVIKGAEVSLAAGVDVSLSDGTVTLPSGYSLGDFDAMLTPNGGGDAAGVAFTDDDSDGVFEVSFRFLMPEDGPFEVHLIGPDGLDFTVNPATPAWPSPAAGETARVDWVLQSATETGGGGDVICPWWICG